MDFPSDEIGLDRLLLDDENPRLPESLSKAPQHEILRWMYENAVLEELAVSFVEHGYLNHEPLFVMKADSHQWIVLEGNRRLAALMVLMETETAVEADLRFSSKEIEPDLTQKDRLRRIPVRIVSSRDDVRDFLGFRHIGGIKEWPPEAKARWIEEEIARRNAPGDSNVFAQIGKSVGTNAQSIRGPYLALRILRFAKDELTHEGVANQVRFVQDNRFGVLVRATNSPDLRSYLAPEGPSDLRTLSLVESLVVALAADRIARVLGDMVPAEGRRRAILSDSRDVTVYARALQDPIANQILVDYGDLGLAEQVIDRQALPERIRAIERSIRMLLDELQRDPSEIPSGSDEAAAGMALASQSLKIQIDGRLQAL